MRSVDAWQVMEDLAPALQAAIGAVEFVRLPRKTKTLPTLVVAASDGPAVLESLRHTTGPAVGGSPPRSTASCESPGL